MKQGKGHRGEVCVAVVHGYDDRRATWGGEQLAGLVQLLVWCPPGMMPVQICQLPGKFACGKAARVVHAFGAESVVHNSADMTKGQTPAQGLEAGYEQEEFLNR